MVQIRKFLLIDNAYKSRILSGKKTTTIRFGDYEVEPGSEVYLVITPSDTAIAKVRITKVEKKKVKELTTQDAKKDGFKDVKELVNTLSKIYGELDGEDEVTVIEFEVIKKFESGIPLKWLKGLNYRDPEEIAKLYVESNLKESPDVDLIIKRVYSEGLKSAVKRYGPKRVRDAFLRAYHRLYAEGKI
ncbi:ASCH domain-containing protein [Thermococcus aggregans]|uniref:ASCH domain-containing protein n=1 Tax=Thermococcus aggregans TaxID=110163 RepID=A0A9E7SNQ2_THEAG|nr:ASCH domain-containing protein [Thermococcus aggregans]USS40569.1 ASCH domain-containing protein [Thermococcus aggregans]